MYELFPLLNKYQLYCFQRDKLSRRHKQYMSMMTFRGQRVRRSRGLRTECSVRKPQSEAPLLC